MDACCPVPDPDSCWSPPPPSLGVLPPLPSASACAALTSDATSPPRVPLAVAASAASSRGAVATVAEWRTSSSSAASAAERVAASGCLSSERYNPWASWSSPAQPKNYARRSEFDKMCAAPSESTSTLVSMKTVSYLLWHCCTVLRTHASATVVGCSGIMQQS